MVCDDLKWWSAEDIHGFTFLFFLLMVQDSSVQQDVQAWAALWGMFQLPGAAEPAESRARAVPGPSGSQVGS